MNRFSGATTIFAQWPAFLALLGSLHGQTVTQSRCRDDNTVDRQNKGLPVLACDRWTFQLCNFVALLPMVISLHL